MSRVKKKWLSVPKEKVELEGPLQCPNCNGHVMLDATYLDQVCLTVVCPYCRRIVHVEEAEQIDENEVLARGYF